MTASSKIQYGCPFPASTFSSTSTAHAALMPSGAPLHNGVILGSGTQSPNAYSHETHFNI